MRLDMPGLGVLELEHRAWEFERVYFILFNELSFPVSLPKRVWGGGSKGRKVDEGRRGDQLRGEGRARSQGAHGHVAVVVFWFSLLLNMNELKLYAFKEDDCLLKEPLIHHLCPLMNVRMSVCLMCQYDL